MPLVPTGRPGNPEGLRAALVDGCRIPRAVLLIVVSLSLVVVASVTGGGWAQSGGVEVVYVTNGHVPAHTLAGGPLAAATNSSILTVARPQQGDVLPDATAAALRALSPDRIVILGGPAAVSRAWRRSYGRMPSRAPPDNRCGGLRTSRATSRLRCFARSVVVAMGATVRPQPVEYRPASNHGWRVVP